jgi:predicted nucleotidyltransferase
MLRTKSKLIDSCWKKNDKRLNKCNMKRLIGFTSRYQNYLRKFGKTINHKIDTKTGY